MSNESAYSIYADSRPMRVLYLLENSPSSFSVFDYISERNRNCWGGRFCPIILAKGGNLTQEQLDFIKNYDPDVVKCIGNIKKGVIKKVNLVVTPYQFSIDALNNEYIRVEPESERAEYLPNESFISMITKTEASSCQLVLFDMQDLKDDDIKKFIIRNFGILDTIYSTKKSLESVNTISIKVSDGASLVEALKTLREARNIIFPIQFCATHCPVNEIERQNFEETLDICIGDSLMDIIFSWNKSLSVPYWKRSHINSFWVPKSLLRSIEFVKYFDLFIQRYSKSYTSFGYESIRIISHSLNIKNLNDFGDKITSGYFYHKKIEKLENKQTFASYVKFFTFDRLKNGLQYFRLNSSEEELIISPPLSPEIIKNSGSWMVDLYVNKGVQDLYYSNLETWLQLPAKNILAHSVLPGSPSRITRNGLPSCVARAPFSEPIAENGNVIKFRMIAEDELFRSLMLSNSKAFRNTSYYAEDARKNILDKEYINDSEISSSGRYLMGFVGNFSGLSYAHNFFSQKYWNHVLNYLSGKDPEKDRKLINDLKNKIQRDVRRGNVPAQDAESMALYLLDLAKKYDLPSHKGVSYEIFEKSLFLKDARLNDGNLSKKKKAAILNELKCDLREEMNELIQLGVLLMGYYLKCPNCGFAEWRNLKDVSQEVSCRGCNYSFFLEAEQKISYRLNSLIQSGIAKYNLVPVVVTFAKLFQRARHFFAFYPSMDVFAPKKSTPFTDVDLICIVDGKLILGECKLHSDDFKQKDYEKMEIVAKALRPSELVFAALHGTETVNIKNKLKELEDKLSPLEIKVKWIGENYIPHIDK